MKGRDKVMAYIQQSVSTARTSHQVHVPEIELNGDEADVIWAEPKDGVASLNGYGQYHQRFVRQNG